MCSVPLNANEDIVLLPAIKSSQTKKNEKKVSLMKLIFCSSKRPN